MVSLRKDDMMYIKTTLAITFCAIVLMLSAGCEEIYIDVIDDWGDDDTTDDDDTGDDTDDDDIDDDDDVDDDDVDDDDDDVDDDDDDIGDDDTETWPAWTEVTLDMADASIIGENVGDWLGGTLAAPGDMDGDGIEDVAISAPYYSAIADHAGKVYIVLGRTNGWTVDENPGQFPSVVSDVEQHELWQVQWVGDVNADGLADLLVPAEHGENDGHIHQYLLLGRSGGWVQEMPYTDLDARTTDVNGTIYSGIVTHGYLGDVDGDGHDDWLLSNRTSLDQAGQGVVISGAAIQPEIEVPTQALGWVYGDTEEYIEVVPLRGDINGDGMADIVAYPRGGNNSYDYIYLLLGRNAGFPHDEQLGNVTDSRFVPPGSGVVSVGVAGDVNGDGVDDLAVTSLSGAQMVEEGTYLFFGRNTWPAELLPNDADVLVGGIDEESTVLSSPGDVNGDGIDELLFFNDTNIYLYFGRTNGWPATLSTGDADVRIAPAAWMSTIYSYGSEIYLGSTNQPGMRGDIDGDGINDLILHNCAADGFYSNLSDAGALFVFSGRTNWPSNMDTDDADASFVGDVLYESVGYPGRTLLADVNGDGKDDILMSTYRRPLETQGGVYIFFGHERGP